ncbi:MAG: hypothetical protein IJA26_00505 [Clostridia bacterium]|nr:hypothetical protein [Clostridia bacterium]
MKKLCLILMIIALLNVFALAEGEMNISSPTLMTEIEVFTAAPTATPEPKGYVFSCETLIITLPEGYTMLDEADTTGYTAAVEDAYQTGAHLLFAAKNETSGAICMAMIEDATPAIDACRAAAENMLGSSDNAGEYTYGENTYAGFACALDSSVFQIYYISDGTHLVTVTTANLSAEEIAAMLGSLNF